MCIFFIGGLVIGHLLAVVVGPPIVTWLIDAQSTRRANRELER